METKMNISPPKRISQIDKYLQLDEAKFVITSTKDAYKFIKHTTWNLYYKKLKKKEKGKVLKFLCIITGWSKSHIKRLVGLSIKGKLHYKPPQRNRTSFTKKYTTEDIALIAEFDNYTRRSNANALIHNFRKTNLYRNCSQTFTRTNSVQNTIGVRTKPRPNGQPGFLRVDSVHGGDKNGKKGMYYVNFVDEVLQWEIVISVATITQTDLETLYREVLESFPFKIQNFHSDNGSELINDYLASILEDLHIKQTKSRPRKHNDNALVESKNGWVIRKHFGYIFRPKQSAEIVQEYLAVFFNRYLNYNRPCSFPNVTYKGNGKKIVKYPKDEYKTPYEKLKSVDPDGVYLKNGLTYKSLDRIALEYSDYEFVKIMNKEYKNMMKKFKNQFSPISVSS
jgi:transposase InsO family protein